VRPLIRNVVEERVVEAYDQIRGSFPGFCGCDLCRSDVIVYALNRLPARYVSTPEGLVMTEVRLEKEEDRAPIDVMVAEGIQRVSMAPRCQGPRVLRP